MYFKGINKTGYLFICTIFAALLLSSNPLQAREIRHSKIKSNCGCAKSRGAQNTQRKVTAPKRNITSMRSVKRKPDVKNCKDIKPSRSKLPTIHFGPGPGDGAKQIHFGPGPGDGAKQIHFGPGPGSNAVRAINFGSRSGR